jgi:EH_Signature domain
VKTALQRGSEGVTALPRRLLACVPFAALYDDSTWRADQGIIDAYLRRLGGETHRSLFRNLWTHYLLTFEHDDAATNAVARFLNRHFDKLPDPLAGFTRKYEFLNPLTGPLQMAKAALAGNELLEDLKSIGVTPERLRTSALIVAILGCVGRVLKTESVRGDPVSRVRALLAKHMTDVIQQAQGHIDLRKRAVKSFVEGFIAWQQKPERANANPEPALSLLLEINRDPRFLPGRWRGIVDETAISTVEAWLSRKTIEAFFRVVNDLHVDRRDMWDERKKFWLTYLPFVKKAWLIVGSGAIPLAQREGVQFGTFGAARSGTTVVCSC